MSRPYGPIPLTAGIVTFQDIDPGAAWVVIENSSLSFDIGVCFQVNAPPPVTTFSGPPWDGVIQAGGWRKFQLPSTDNNRQWTGRVWLLPIDVSGYSAATGTISGYARVYMTTYLPGEEPADAPTIVRGLDIVSQPRVISIPMVPFGAYSTSVLVTTGNDYQPFPATWAVTSPTFDSGANLFIYWLDVGPGITDGLCNFSIRVICRDYTIPATILATFDILYGSCGKTGSIGERWPQAGMPTPFYWAARRTSVIPTNTGIIEIALHDFASPAAWPLQWNMQIDSDKLSPSLVTVPGIGGGLNPDVYAPGGNQPKF